MLLEVIDMHYYRYLDIKIHPPPSKKNYNIKNKSIYRKKKKNQNAVKSIHCDTEKRTKFKIM